MIFYTCFLQPSYLHSEGEGAFSPLLPCVPGLSCEEGLHDLQV